ncbi:MAG: hypothetical protein K6G69_07575 [Lachnospiraceae bacterium]|nr:hypothetical protein [Lachnospiraceae bacterium]
MGENTKTGPKEKNKKMNTVKLVFNIVIVILTLIMIVAGVGCIMEYRDAYTYNKLDENSFYYPMSSKRYNELNNIIYRASSDSYPEFDQYLAVAEYYNKEREYLALKYVGSDLSDIVKPDRDAFKKRAGDIDYCLDNIDAHFDKAIKGESNVQEQEQPE